MLVGSLPAALTGAVWWLRPHSYPFGTKDRFADLYSVRSRLGGHGPAAWSPRPPLPYRWSGSARSGYVIDHLERQVLGLAAAGGPLDPFRRVLAALGVEVLEGGAS